jgi:general secretion pathway protein F/type IV pilus assembly protein PilC
MPNFVYEAQNTSGQLIKGSLQSPSQRDAIRKLNESHLLPLRVVEQTIANSRVAKLSAAQLASLCQMLADLLESGMPLLKSLEMVAGQNSNAHVAATLAEVTDRVADGSSLATALAAFPKTFDELTCNMIRAGEEGGFLEESLKRVAVLHERRSVLTSNLMGALAYPAFLLIVGLVVVTGMITFFVPKFEPLFDRMRSAGQLPWSTQTLLGLSSLLRHQGLWLIALALALALAAKVWLSSDPGRLRFDRWKLKVKFGGSILTAAAMSVVCRVLGTLLGNGVPMLDALRIAQGTTNNRALRQVIQHAASRVAAGGRLADQLSQDALIPDEIVEVIRNGERSNRLDTVLLKIADQLESRTQRQLAVLAKLVEPVLMVVMAILIGFLMLALLMPVFLSSGRFN